MSPTPPGRSRWLEPDKLTESLAALVQINSVNPGFGGPQGGERQVLERAAGILASAGLTPRLVETQPGRPLLRTRLRGRTPGPPLVFETHVDTVAVTGMKIEPWGGRVDRGRLWGRGSTDAKGQAVAMMHALAAWAEADAPPPHDVELVLVHDEEFSFGGARALLADGLEAVGIVIGEPTSLRIVTAHKGSVRLWLGVAGKSAHGARPHLGINAISAASALVRVIDEQYVPELARRSAPLVGSPTINVGQIVGGVQPNLVPPSCRMHVDRRTIPGETTDDLRRELEGLFAAAKQLFPQFEGCIEEVTLDARAVQAPTDSALVRAAQAVTGAAGRPTAPIGVDYATDACELGHAGIPFIILGPGSIDQAHTEDEFIEIAELEAGARVYAGLMGRDLSAP
ncbi:MAG TPA: M20/M25/M40 family metallo-hydrolase [Candidatus Sumerlaeota bacterium]|nr:M20/M25/M40 family metallo-hydrolase [Candidatus Sumerlaeota bacterium]HOR28675.1 M20/M25/M40 family metallo-hydrolase [Candidatus Sumerlaeota bacterium]HPK02520.1 M20/M25/M40 family metallo-hydrolase [Candidatus Sumerlaeota bacterium]